MTRRRQPQKPALLVTGGSGFVGKALMAELLGPEPVIDASEIRILDLHPPTVSYDDPRVSFAQGDIRRSQDLKDALEGIDAVIHLAAIVDWGTHPPEDVYAINTEATKNLLEAARVAGVRAFVYTSSLDAVITGESLVDVDESLPYPERAPNAYCGSKARSEEAVMAAHDPPHFSTVCLRPSGVWGEADPYHISALVKQAQAKGPYARIGDGSANQQLVYVGNLAHAHIQACRAILDNPDEAPCGGKAYFVTDAPGENFFRFFDAIVAGAGYSVAPERLWIPRSVMLVLGVLAETIAWLIRPLVRWNPKVSRFAVRYTCADFTFTSQRAQDDFGFTPKYDYKGALLKTMAWFAHYGPIDPPKIP